jgi:hypothetical protein
LREEVTYDSLEGVEAVDWQEATDRFLSWYSDQRDTAVVVENEHGETASFSQPCRFSPEYREMQYARAQALERGLRQEWGKALRTVMLSLTCSSTDDSGRPRPPVDQLRDLLASYDAVRRELARTLDGRDWEYLAILEPHDSGYVHLHIGVFVRGPVVAEQFESVLDTHVENCPTAAAEAHQLLDEVDVHRASHPSRSGGIENLGAYLASYLAGEYNAQPGEQPDFVKRFYAVMWATGRQWFRPSNGAQQYMKPPESDDTADEWATQDWQMVGIAPDGDLDDVIEIDDDEGGGVDKTRLRTDRPPD